MTKQRVIKKFYPRKEVDKTGYNLDKTGYNHPILDFWSPSEESNESYSM